MKKTIVSFSSYGRENYNKAILGLIRSSVTRKFDCDYVINTFDSYVDEYLGVKISNGSWPITKRGGTCWQHADAPYRFKVAMIQKAYEMGYREILWCDSTVRMIADPSPLFELAKERGVVAFDNLGHPLEPYISDTAIRNLGTNIAEIKEMKQIMACCILFNLDNLIGSEVFDRWWEASLDGTFDDDGTVRPGFITGKHDQAALSVILNQYKVPINNYGDGFAYSANMKAGVTDKPICLVNHGIEPI